LKHEPLIGNLMIALITAMIPLLLLFFEFIPLYQAYGNELFAPFREAVLSQEDPAGRLNLIIFWILGYSCFAFITTLIREIQKDLADQPGDRKVGSRTLPIALGEKRTRILVAVLILLFLLGVGLAWGFFLQDTASLLYLIVLIGAPSIWSASLVLKDGGEDRYERASDRMKWTMLMGILFPIFAHMIGPESIFFP
jgi:4-hydroxybenzoate polyprenyltransferase